MGVHGDIVDITVNHPTLGSGRFAPIAANSNTLDVGGIRTSDDQNGLTGNGSLVWKKNRVRAGFECLVENDMNADPGDLVFAAQLSAHPDMAEWTITHINGTVWRGTGKPVGDLSADT